MVLANLGGYFTKLLRYHYLPNKAEAASALGIPPFFVKDYEVAARNYNTGKVFQVISLLREYDLKSKGLDSSGNVDDGELLKELVFKMVH
jgi:DNA polymerase-3 subunit delta